MINMSSSIMAGSAASPLSLRPTTAGRRPRLPRLMDEELFRSVLSYERKRAARSNQPSILLLIAESDRPGRASPASWEAIIQALAAATRESDLPGWIESNPIFAYRKRIRRHSTSGFGERSR
jgi:hypothetical protein